MDCRPWSRTRCPGPSWSPREGCPQYKSNMNFLPRPLPRWYARLSECRWAWAHRPVCLFGCTWGTHLCRPRKKTFRSCSRSFLLFYFSWPWTGSIFLNNGNAPERMNLSICKDCIKINRRPSLPPSCSTCTLPLVFCPQFWSFWARKEFNWWKWKTFYGLFPAPMPFQCPLKTQNTIFGLFSRRLLDLL